MSQDKFPHITYNCGGTPVDCILVAGRYATGNRLAIEAIIAEYIKSEDGMEFFPGEDMGTITVNLPFEPLKDNEVFLDTNNCKCIVEALTRANIGSYANKDAISGFCLYPAWQFSDDEIKQMTEEE